MKALFSLQKVKGLTFLEMVVAIAIWVLALTAIGVIFSQSLRVFKATSGKIEALQEAKLLDEWLVRDIQESFSLVTAGASNITLVSPNLQCISYLWNSTNQTVTRRLGSGQDYLVAQGVTNLSLKYYDVNNKPLSDPLNNTLSLKTIEFDAATEADGRSFRLNSVARFEYNPESPWVRAYGGTGTDYLISLQQTSDGYVLGGLTASFGAGGDDFLLIKTDTTGHLTWAKAYGGTGADSLFSLQQVSDGYVLGGYTSSFGAGGDDFLLIKTNATGNLTWAKAYGNTDYDYLFSLQQVSDGYVLGGWTTSFGAGGFDFLLIKTNATGDLTWAKAYGGTSSDYLYSIQQTSDGYVLGGLTASFGAGGFDFLLIKTNATGDLTWAKAYGGTTDDSLFTMQQNSDGYILGGNTTSFGAGSEDFLLIKTNTTGNLTWAKAYGGTTDDCLYSLQQVSDGYILGGNTTSFGAGSGDFLLIKTNATGNLTWAKAYGNTSNDYLTSLQQTSDGYVLGGYTSSFGAGGNDDLLIKTNATGNLACCGIAQDVALTVTAITTLNVTTCSPTQTNITNVTVTTPSCTVTNITPTTTIICPLP